MSEYFDDLEIRPAEIREAEQMKALAEHVAHAKARSPHYSDLLRDVDAASVNSRKALAALPVTRKSSLIGAQQQDPPFAGLTTSGPKDLQRLFMSPGPIADPEGFGSDWWRMARALYAAGFRKGDIAHNCFSYHLTPAGHMFESGAHAVGCAVFPGGVGQTEAQVQAMAHYRANGYIGTPDYLKVILEKADELGADVSSLKKGLVSGGALFPSLRQEYKDRGIAVLQCYGTADLGLIAYESPAMEGLIVDEDVIVEIVRPGTGDPVAPGEVGEVLVTTFNRDYPLIRFATGDLSAMMDGESPCGRTGPRIKGWMGRADQTTKVKGMFVHPEQVAAVAKRHPEIVKSRLVVSSDEGGKDIMVLKCEASGSLDADKVAETLASVTKLKGSVEFCAPGTLPNDGKVIEDARTYE